MAADAASKELQVKLALFIGALVRERGLAGAAVFLRELADMLDRLSRLPGRTLDE